MTDARAVPSLAEARAAYYAELARANLGALWTVEQTALIAEPPMRELPCLWRWNDVRPWLMRAGELISTEEAARRALMLLNPKNPARIGATATLYAALQMILPGESARAHRHSPSALRFVIEGTGAYTAVDGEQVRMAPGDLVLTPAMVWHDHGNTGDHPVIWLDGLDLPLMIGLNAIFTEEYPERVQPVVMPPAHSEKLLGRALLPAGAARQAPKSHSRVWAYRWSEAREALDTLRRSSDPDPFDGYILRYSNPETGGHALTTMACHLQLIEAGMSLESHRHTTSTIYHVAEGKGHSEAGGERIEWQKGDTFAVPIWVPHRHAADTAEAVLFSVSDEPLMKAVGLDRTGIGAP